MRSVTLDRTRWIAALTAAVAVVAGGLALGSNMGFKYNAQIRGEAPAPKGDNWVSIPYNSPYNKANVVCAQLGLTSTGLNATRGVVARLTASSGAVQSFTCGGSALLNFAITKGEMIRVRAGTSAVATQHGIVVGSHDPAHMQPLVAATPAPKGDNWVSLPYHTTAVKAQDLCVDMGLTSTGLNSGRGTVARITASTGVIQTYTCGGSALTNFALTIGEGLRVRTSASGSWVPSHF